MHRAVAIGVLDGYDLAFPFVFIDWFWHAVGWGFQIRGGDGILDAVAIDAVVPLREVLLRGEADHHQCAFVPFRIHRSPFIVIADAPGVERDVLVIG